MISDREIARLLQPYVAPAASVTDDASAGHRVDWSTVYGQLAVYLELILKWNARTNLTAIREPEQIVRRHFGESLFAGSYVGDCRTLLDFGSGAGFPGVPIQLMRPDVRVTLAESQGKKAAFLREVVRELGLASEVWAGRVETMPEERRFDAVALRAVDRMGMAVQEAKHRAERKMLVLGTTQVAEGLELDAGFREIVRLPLPESVEGILFVAQR